MLPVSVTVLLIIFSLSCLNYIVHGNYLQLSLSCLTIHCRRRISVKEYSEYVDSFCSLILIADCSSLLPYM